MSKVSHVVTSHHQHVLLCPVEQEDDAMFEWCREIS